MFLASGDQPKLSQLADAMAPKRAAAGDEAGDEAKGPKTCRFLKMKNKFHFNYCFIYFYYVFFFIMSFLFHFFFRRAKFHTSCFGAGRLHDSCAAKGKGQGVLAGRG